MNLDTVLRGAHVVSSALEGRFDIGIAGGKTVAIADPAQGLDAGEVVDLSGTVLVPGVVDAHVHFRGSPRDAGESFEVGSAAAAAGGVTTVLEMPITEPMVTSGGRLSERARYLGSRSHVDYALFGGVGSGNLAEIGPMKQAGAIGFKSFLHEAPPGREETLGRIALRGNGELYDAISAVASTGLVHALHAEDGELLNFLQTVTPKAPPGRFHIKSRPALLEDLAVDAALKIAEEVRARLHFVHVASARAVDRISMMKRAGVDASVETAPHYLRFTEDMLRKHGMRAKCNPPLRSSNQQQELIRRVATGAVEIIASDHCTYPQELIDDTLENPIEAPAGFPGIQSLLVGLMSLADSGALSLKTVVNALSSSPARRYGLTAKGDIRPGMDADYVVVDKCERTALSRVEHRSIAAANHPIVASDAYTYRVKQTWLRGQRIYDDGDLLVDTGYGCFIRPSTP